MVETVLTVIIHYTDRSSNTTLSADKLLDDRLIQKIAFHACAPSNFLQMPKA